MVQGSKITRRDEATADIAITCEVCGRVQHLSVPYKNAERYAHGASVADSFHDCMSISQLAVMIYSSCLTCLEEPPKRVASN